MRKICQKKLILILFHHNSIRKGLGKKMVDKKKLIKELIKISPKILKYSTTSVEKNRRI